MNMITGTAMLDYSIHESVQFGERIPDTVFCFHWGTKGILLFFQKT